MESLVLSLIERYRRLGGGERLAIECNFEPGCSAFARTAIERFGLIRGGRLALDRLRRCRVRDTVCKCLEPVPKRLENAE